MKELDVLRVLAGLLRSNRLSATQEHWIRAAYVTLLLVLLARELRALRTR